MFLALGPIFVTPANAVTVSTPTYTSIIGGSGGGDDASPLDCGSSKVVVEVRTGGTNDSAFAIVCATLNADGTVGTKDSTAIFSRFGSGASHNFISECPSGQAMVAIQTSRNTWLGAAQVECAEPPTGTAKTLGSITSTRTWNWGSGTCNAGEFVSAIRTRTGGSVDGIYLGCSTISNFGVAPATVSSRSPSGSLIEGSTLTSEVSFSGVPAPTLTYVWEFSQDGSSGWNAIAGATSSTFTLSTNEVGGYLRTVVTATNTSGTLAATSSATGQVMAPAPAPTPTPSTPPPPPPPTAGEAAAAGEDALENAADYFTANNIDLSNYSQNALVIEWNWLTQQYAQAISEGRNSRAMTYASSMNSKLRQIVAAYEAGTLAQNPSPTPAPEPVAPEPEPEPVAPEPEPVAPEPAPEPVAPEPEPEPVVPEPEPELVAPEPVAPQPVAPEPAPEPEAPAPVEPNPEPQPNTPEPVQPAPEPEPTPEVNSEPKPTPAPTPTATPTDNTPPATTAPSEPEPPVAAPPPSSETGFFADPGEFLAESFTAAAELLAELQLIEIPVVGEPVENLAIGASGDDSVIVEFDPVGTPEAVEATNKLLAATGAIAGVAAAAGAAAAAAAAAGAAGAAASAAGAAGAASSAAGAAGSAGATGAEMSEDAMDSLAEAGFDLDAFTGEPPGRGDNLGAWSLASLVFLDRPTRDWTKRTARFSPLLSKLLNDGIYLRAMLGSISVLPLIAAVVFAVLGLQENAGTLLHPPVPLFLAIGLIGLFDSFAGVVGISVFILGSLPLVDPTSLEDWRMLAGTAVAGFGPILIARSIRNFRRRPIPGVDGLLARVGDIAFASLMGGWVAGLVFRALPALTGLTVPAANHVATFQMLATIAIALRIVLEDLAARNFPHRMDALAPDVVPEPPRAQVVTSLVLKYLLYVFVASAFMGLGLAVWIAAAMFMIPTLLDFVKDRLPVSRTLWSWLPVGLPGLAMILGLEILLENALSVPFGENENFSVIFIFSLISMLIVLSVLGALGRSGGPGEQRLFERPSMRWIARLGGLVTFLLLVQFTSML